MLYFTFLYLSSSHARIVLGVGNGYNQVHGTISWHDCKCVQLLTTVRVVQQYYLIVLVTGVN